VCLHHQDRETGAADIATAIKAREKNTQKTRFLLEEAPLKDG
jgi:hypothetical protein